MSDSNDFNISKRLDATVTAGKLHKQRTAGSDAFKAVGTEADTTITFRVNKELKEAFSKVCKTNHSTLSREIKLFMNKVVREQTTDI